MHHRWLAACLTLILTAGCLAEAPSDATDPEPAALPASPRVATVSCDDGCWEPTIAMTPDGTVYVTSAEQELWRLPVNGAALEPVAVPPVATGSWRGDVTIDADGAGNLYFSSLSSTTLPLGGSARVIEVLVSGDDGATWTGDILGPFDDAPTSASDHTLDADRQWLIFDDQAVTMTFQRPTFIANRYASEVVMAQAPLGTVDFGDWSMVTPIETRAGGKIHGQGVATDDGVLVPAWMNDPMVPLSSGLWLAHVAPDGTTYHGVAPQTSGGWFPAITQLADGGFAAAWFGAGGDLMTATSADGRDWSEPAKVGTDLVTSPWLAPWQDGAALLWHEADGDGTRLLLATGAAGAAGNWSAPVVVADGITGKYGRASNTDMAHMAAAGDRLAVVWSGVAANELGVAVYGPGNLP